MKAELLQSYKIKQDNDGTRWDKTMVEQGRAEWENWMKVDQNKPGNHTEWLAVRIRHILMWWDTIEDLKTE